MYSYDYHTRVRHTETDITGCADCRSLAVYHEEAQIEALRHLGLSYKLMEDRGFIIPALDYQVQYHRPARFDDELLLRVIIRKKPGIRIRFDLEMYDADGRLLNTAVINTVVVNTTSGRPCFLPEDVMQTILPYFTN